MIHNTMFKTSGFALRKMDYREYDRIYTVYTSDFGKISLLARGARRIKSKLAPHLEGLNEVRLNFAKGKIFNHLSGANVVGVNKGLLKDGEKIAFISDCFYLLDRFIKPEEGDVRIYDLMKEVFGAIANIPSVIPSEAAAEPRDLTPPNRETGDISPRAPLGRNDMIKIKVYFFWRLADLLGYRPQLDECVLCGSIIIGSSKFNITENIVICGKCRGEGIKISEMALENLRTVFRMPLREFIKYNLDSQLFNITNNARQIKLSEL